MIWYWLMRVLRYIGWLLRPPAPRDVARVLPSAPCPACGNAPSPIRTVKRGDAIYVQHTCSVCGARWHELPITKLRPDMVWPAVPRTDIEYAEELNAKWPTPDVVKKPVAASGEGKVN